MQTGAQGMASGDKAFTGSIPAIYDEYLVPIWFAPYAEDLVRRLSGVMRGRVLEIAAGSGAACPQNMLGGPLHARSGPGD